MIYADYAATAPLSERVYETLCRVSRDIFGNPSSAHSAGRAAAALVDRAREQTAALLGCSPDEIVFTSGGTEADNHALRFAEGKTVLTSSIEHPAVLNAARKMASRVCLAHPDADGHVSAGRIADLLREVPETALVSLMYANNETGVIQPVREAADAAHAAGALFHCDAVQGTGHCMPTVRELDCDLLSVSGHKFHAPKGIGALYIHKRLAGQVPPLLYGGGQQGGLRSGTLPVPLIAAFGEACAEAAEVMCAEDARVRRLRDAMADELLALPGSLRIGAGEVLPGILNIAFAGTYAENLMLLCDLRGVCLSAGSACHAGNDTPSHVLEAMGVPEEYRSSAIRISIGRFTSAEDAAEIAAVVRECVALAREG